MYGVELDSISGRIAQQLYQKVYNSSKCLWKSRITRQLFRCSSSAMYHLMNTNQTIKRYNKNKFLTHDYFFAKTLDKVRPRWSYCFITSKGTMDKKNSEVRKYIAQRAELLGAIRLPNNTFTKNAGTKVTSDILFLKKKREYDRYYARLGLFRHWQKWYYNE